MNIIDFPDLKKDKLQYMQQEIRNRSEELTNLALELQALMGEYSELSGDSKLEELCIRMMKSIFS